MPPKLTSSDTTRSARDRRPPGFGPRGGSQRCRSHLGHPEGLPGLEELVAGADGRGGPPFGPAWPGLGEHLPVRDLLAWLLTPPSRHNMRHVRDPCAKDE